MKVFVSKGILLGHLDQKITTVEDKRKTEFWYTLRTVLFISATHHPNKKHDTSVTLVSNNIMASLRFLFKQLKAKVLCMFFFGTRFSCPEFVTVESIVGLETSMMGNFSPPSPREIYRPFIKGLGFLNEHPNKIASLREGPEISWGYSLYISRY